MAWIGRLAGAALAGSLLAVPAKAARPETLVVGLHTDDAADRPLIAAAAQAIGVDLRIRPRAQRLAGKPPADVDAVVVNGAELAAGCAAGGLLPLDPALLGAPPPTRCGVPFGGRALHLAWNPARIATAPDWGAFWDVARLPGRRGLARGARGTMEVALLADGVPPPELYRVLRTPEGVDRAFRRLDQLRPYVSWWTDPAQPARMIAASEVLMTTAAAPPIAPGHGLSLSDSALASPESLALGAGTHRDAAYCLLRVLAQNASPAAPAQPGRSLPIDEAFWRENGAALDARFKAWLAR